MSLSHKVFWVRRDTNCIDSRHLRSSSLFILTRVQTRKKYRILCYPLRSNSGWLPIRFAYFILTFVLFFPHFHAHVYFHAHSAFQLCRNWWNSPLEIQCITSIVISHFFMHSTFMLILMLQFWYPVIQQLHNDIEFATVFHRL